MAICAVSCTSPGLLLLSLDRNHRPLKLLTTSRSQHPNVPSKELVSHITHVELAFMNSDTFNKDVAEWPLFTTVEKVRTQFRRGTKVMVAIGGWSDTKGFDTAARTAESREKWAKNVADMVKATGADGMALFRSDRG